LSHEEGDDALSDAEEEEEVVIGWEEVSEKKKIGTLPCLVNVQVNRDLIVGGNRSSRRSSNTASSSSASTSTSTSSKRTKAATSMIIPFPVLEDIDDELTNLPTPKSRSNSHNNSMDASNTRGDVSECKEDAEVATNSNSNNNDDDNGDASSLQVLSYEMKLLQNQLAELTMENLALRKKLSDISTLADRALTPLSLSSSSSSSKSSSTSQLKSSVESSTTSRQLSGMVPISSSKRGKRSAYKH
jgi:hypothetical protein